MCGISLGAVRGIGSSECRFILIFDDGAFAEAHTLSITDWLIRFGCSEFVDAHD
jgi:hypothetical protein